MRDPAADERRLRGAVLLCAAALLAVLAAAGARALAPEWREHQRSFVERHGGAAPGIVQAETCAGEVDRCATCHLGATRRDLADPAVPQPGRGHALPLEAHLAVGVGCTDCHGGSGRALTVAAAHAFPGSAERDPLLRAPHVEAGCARCHVPGDRPGMERLVRGAALFAELGCAICHPLSGEGRGGWDFGPDLRAGARRSAAFLERSLAEPAADFPDSTMPSFAGVRDADPAGFTALVVYLESLALPRAEGCSVRERSAQLAVLPCASCHAGAGGRASGRLEHRCLYLRERRAQLSCAGCHPEAIPAAGTGGGVCPVEREHRGACAACHEGLAEVRR